MCVCVCTHVCVHEAISLRELMKNNVRSDRATLLTDTCANAAAAAVSQRLIGGWFP